MGNLIEKPIHIPISSDSIELEGILAIPKHAAGIVIFVHGSGSSRHSPRNNYVAKKLQEAGFATLLFDLLTEQEDLVYEARFDIHLLAKRLVTATSWISNQPQITTLDLGYFGASTGSAAALIAAAMLGSKIKTIVSRGGRPDLAASALNAVKTPTLFIVGGLDFEVIELNKKAIRLLTAPNKMNIVPGATHLFEESGALEEVTKLTIAWFKIYLHSGENNKAQ